MSTGTIIAIGGGEIRTGGTNGIDREIIRMTGRRRPGLLFIPTASDDSARYCRHVEEHFGRRLRCDVAILRLMQDQPNERDRREPILGADAIYVGGGNTLRMMRLWRRLGVDSLLRTAATRGAVLSGISAGAICWFANGHSDSMSFYDPHHWQYIRVQGLGLLPGTFCPHYDGYTRRVPRRRFFRAMIGSMGGTGIAVENNCAVEVVDDRFRILTSKPEAAAYRVWRSAGTVRVERVPQSRQFTPIESLYQPTTR